MVLFLMSHWGAILTVDRKFNVLIIMTLLPTQNILPLLLKVSDVVFVDLCTCRLFVLIVFKPTLTRFIFFASKCNMNYGVLGCSRLSIVALCSTYAHNGVCCEAFVGIGVDLRFLLKLGNPHNQKLIVLTKIF